MATFVKFAVYKPMGFPLWIHYIDTAGNPIIGADGQPMIKLIDLTKTAATESDGFIDLKNVLYAQAIDGYEFTSNINTGNAEESKTLVGAETGEISGAPENRKVTIGSYTGYQLRFIKYDNGTFYAAMGNRTGNNRFAITGKPAVYLTYKALGVALSSLAVGTKVKSSGAVYYGQPITWLIIGKNHDGENTVSLLSDRILCEKGFDAIEPDNIDADRKRNGNNRYAVSNLLQWLNSDAEPGKWYVNKHSSDHAPSAGFLNPDLNPYTDKAGFLNSFTQRFKNNLRSVRKTTVKNTVRDGGGSENIEAKVHLLSKTECGLGNENYISEGKIYEYFNQNNSNENRKANPTIECATNGEYEPVSADLPWTWWLRTPEAKSTAGEYYIKTDGGVVGGYAMHGHLGVRPLIVVSSTTLVGRTPDTDGTYIMQI